MSLTFDERLSDSPFVERVWSSHSERAGSFTSISARHWQMVVTKCEGQTTMTIRGPETQATSMDYPAAAEWFGIDFKLGAFMPHLPPIEIINHKDVNLPEAASHTFWLQSAPWQFPNYENADTFVDRLVRDGLLVRDPVVEAVTHGHPPMVSPRAVQYRFLRSTGLTLRAIQQIDRARQAAARLLQGESILDIVFEEGYSDQPHLTRSLRRFIGHTPARIMAAQIVDLNKADQLALLFKT